MSVRLFPWRRDAQGKWWHALAKTIIGTLTFLAFLLGIVVGEYDDAPGAVAISPLIAFGISVMTYAALLSIFFGWRRRH